MVVIIKDVDFSRHEFFYLEYFPPLTFKFITSHSVLTNLLPFSSSPLALSFYVGFKAWYNINFSFWRLLCKVDTVYFLSGKKKVSNEKKHYLVSVPILSIYQKLIVVPPLSSTFISFEAHRRSYSFYYCFLGSISCFACNFNNRINILLVFM